MYGTRSTSLFRSAPRIFFARKRRSSCTKARRTWRYSQAPIRESSSKSGRPQHPYGRPIQRHRLARVLRHRGSRPLERNADLTSVSQTVPIQVTRIRQSAPGERARTRSIRLARVVRQKPTYYPTYGSERVIDDAPRRQAWQPIIRHCIGSR